MGSQQLLLIVLGVVLIGLMIIVGMTMFKDQASSTNRDSISNDLQYFAVQVQKYYRRPLMLGGGDHSFNGLTFAKIAKYATNSNGVYVLSPDPGSTSDTFMRITGTGTNTGNNGTSSVQMRVTVWSDSTYFESMN